MNIFNKFFSLFKRNKRNNDIKKFSTSTTTAKEGTDSIEDLIPNFRDIYEKLKEGNTKLTANELNLVIKYIFKEKELTSKAFKVNPVIFNSCVFEIHDVYLNYDKKTKEITNLKLILVDLIYNSNIVLTIPIESVQDFLTPFHFKRNNRKGKISNAK